MDSWFHLFFNHWTSGYSGKTQFFFCSLENFAAKFPRLFLAAPEKPAVALVAEPAAGVDLEHCSFVSGKDVRCWNRFSGDIFCEFVLVPIEADLFVIELNAEFCHLWVPLAPVNLLPAFPHRLATFPSYHEPHRAHRRPCAVQRTGHGPWFLSCSRVIFDVFFFHLVAGVVCTGRSYDHYDLPAGNFWICQARETSEFGQLDDFQFRISLEPLQWQPTLIGKKYESLISLAGETREKFPWSNPVIQTWVQRCSAYSWLLRGSEGRGRLRVSQISSWSWGHGYVVGKKTWAYLQRRIWMWIWIWIRNGYPLVNIQKAIEHGPVEIVDFPMKNKVDLSIAKC